MKCLVVLAHFMSREALLEPESVSRAQLAISAFKAGHFRYLVTTGWAYRPDCDIPISDAFKDYILDFRRLQVITSQNEDFRWR